jgi:hypothetical protein
MWRVRITIVAVEKQYIYIYIYIYPTNFVEKNQNTYLRYDIMLKYIAEPDRPQITIWRMAIACWITKAVRIISAYCFSTENIVAPTKLIATFKVHTLAVFSNVYLHVTFTPQRTQCDYIRQPSIGLL